MPEFRTLRCANAHLYLAACIIVLAAAAYVLCCKAPLWQQAAAVLAAIITPAWSAHYLVLRYTVCQSGITRRSLCGTTTLAWAELTTAELQETSSQGTASCTILLQAGAKQLRISSDQLPLEDVQELAAELQQLGIIPHPAAR